MNETTAPTREARMTVWSRILIKLMALFFAFYFQLELNQVLVVAGSMFLTELYELVGKRYVAKYPGRRQVVYSILGFIDMLIAVSLLRYTGLLFTDVFTILYLIALAIAMPGGLLGGLGAGLIGAFLYVLFTFGHLEPLSVMIRAMMLIMLSALAGSLSEAALRAEKKSAILEEMLNHREEAKNLKDEFLVIAYHNLRTPLTALKGYKELLQGPQTTDIDRTRTLDRMSQSIDRIESLIEDILEVIKLESEKTSLHLSRADIVEVTKSIIVRFLPDAQRKSIRLTSSYPEKPVLVNLDVKKIDSALSNLVENAIKYTPASGGVKVSVIDKEAQVLLEVRDTGPGMRPEEKSHLFEKFYRVNSLSSTVEGVGLGLYTAQLIAQRHGGAISVVSEPGKGSVFTLTLPKESSQAFLENLA